jgi:hypothetical protein
MNHPAAVVPLAAPQRWKLWLWAVALCMSGACLFAPEQLSRVFGASEAHFTLYGIALGFVALLGISLSVRCPSCGLSLAWYSLSKQSHSAWFSWLLDVETCPRCSFTLASAVKHHSK